MKPLDIRMNLHPVKAQCADLFYILFKIIRIRMDRTETCKGSFCLCRALQGISMLLMGSFSPIRQRK